MFSLEGQKALVFGIANDQSIAHGGVKAVRVVSGRIGEIAPRSFEMLHRFREIPGLDATVTDVLGDPLGAGMGNGMEAAVQ